MSVKAKLPRGNECNDKGKKKLKMQQDVKTSSHKTNASGESVAADD